MPRRFVMSALVLLASAVSGCYSWTSPVPPSTSVHRDIAEDMRVTLTDGRQFVSHEAIVLRDSLIGDTTGGGWGDLAHRVAIPLANIRSLSRYESSPVGSLLLVGGISVVLVYVAMLGYRPQFFSR